MTRAAAIIAAVSIGAQRIGGGPDLEPSVENEVFHAISIAPAVPRQAVPAGDVFGKHGVNATQIAWKLDPMQNSEGRWMCGTNDCTAAAVAILRRIAKETQE